jgi:hypothetical protein
MGSTSMIFQAKGRRGSLEFERVYAAISSLGGLLDLYRIGRNLLGYPKEKRIVLS